MVEYFKAGGICMWPLLACALIGLAIIFERFVVLSRMPSSAKAEKELTSVEHVLAEGGLEGCAQKISKGKGALNYVFARLLKRFDELAFEKKELDQQRKEIASSLGSQDPVTKFLVAQAELTEFRDELLLTVQEASKSYVSRFLAALNTVSNVAPLWGLLGTVTGMIKAFNSIAASGTGDPKVVANGIAEALITTAVGLFIAIPAVVFYRWLGAKADVARANTEVYAVSFSNTLLALLEKK